MKFVAEFDVGGRSGEGAALLTICEYIVSRPLVVLLAAVDVEGAVIEAVVVFVEVFPLEDELATVEFWADFGAEDAVEEEGVFFGDSDALELFFSFVGAFLLSSSAAAAAFSASCFFLWFWQNLTFALLGTETKHFFPPSTCSQNL